MFIRKSIRNFKNKVTFALKDNQVKKNKLAIPRLIYEKDEVAQSYPSIFKFYPNISFLDAVTEYTESFKTAAVIFNSARVLEKKCGSEIDTKDIVVRINFMPTFGFEEYVGSKTTIRVLGRDWIFQENKEVLIHTYNSEKYLKSDIENYKNSQKLRENPLYLSRHDEINSVFKPYLGGMMTNGFRAVLIALSLCDRVTIYGADPASENYSKGKALGHFPRKSELNYIKQKMQDWNIKQDFDWYFNPIDKGKVTGTHNTINREYTFYRLHPRIDLAV